VRQLKGRVDVSKTDQLRDALVRLDCASRNRASAALKQVDQTVSNIGARVENSVRTRLYTHAWLLIGVAFGVGMVLGQKSRGSPEAPRG
jgi:ElaB/YqjD/DUF883 family membrane-anchored ribosome-binding protein